jgi:hypothetical protein
MQDGSFDFVWTPLFLQVEDSAGQGRKNEIGFIANRISNSDFLQTLPFD